VGGQNTRTACANTACQGHQEQFTRGLFCSLCGSPIADIAYSITVDSVDQYDVSEQIHERLCAPSGDAYQNWVPQNNAHLWKPNINYGGRNGHLESREGFALVLLRPNDVLNERDIFAAFFASDLARLRQVYGDDAVMVEWGIIQDYY
jgi:hypothetical protein